MSFEALRDSRMRSSVESRARGLSLVGALMWRLLCGRLVVVVWSRLPGMYRARSRDGVVYASWVPDKEEKEVVAGEVSKRYA